ncbi:DUF4169 family protein [Aquamicrobium zhengzhouense]|nr:DUF4169 family protein [Aquamicrobium zhengzhouense]
MTLSGKSNFPMAEIVNLRMARKQQMRAAKEKSAEQNRTLFGMTKAERESIRIERERTVSVVDAHLRERKDNSDKS